MTDDQMSFPCKEPECPESVIYKREPIRVYRESSEQRSLAGERDGVKRVYLKCPRKHSHEYTVPW